MGEQPPAGQQQQQQQQGRLVSSLLVGQRAREVILDQGLLLWRDPQPPHRGGGQGEWLEEGPDAAPPPG